MNRYRNLYTGRLSVKFGLTVGLLGIIAALLFVGIVSTIQRQTRAAAAAQLTVETIAMGERILQNALQLHYSEIDVSSELEANIGAFETNLATLKNGNPARGIDAPGASLGAALDNVVARWEAAREGLSQLQQDNTNEAALDTVTSNFEALNSAWARITLLNDVRADLVSNRLFTLIPLLVIASIIVFVILLLAIRQVLQQVNDISGVFDAISAGNFEARAVPMSRDELGEMARSLNSILDNTLTRIQSQSERDQLQNTIMKLLNELSNAADGDLTVEAEVTTEITGAIADSFNYMILQLRDVIGNVQSTTQVVRCSASEVQTSTEALARLSELQSRRIAATSSEISNMASEIRSVSVLATRSAEVSSDARNSAVEGSQAVADTIQGMVRIRSQVQETAKRIKRLGESSQEIGEIIQLIGDIADRTSILALNASIQAAMAGDAGKGFGVVAQEVEQLAECATESTRRIEALVKAIQSETKEAVVAMESTTSEVVKGSELAIQAGQALESIESVSTELADLITSISQDTQRQAQESEEIATSVGEISELIRENAEGTQRTAVTISSMAQQAEQLRSSLETFKLPAMSVNGHG